MRTPTTFLTRLLTGKFGILCSVTKGRVVLRSPKKQQQQQHILILNLETSLPGLLNEMALRPWETSGLLGFLRLRVQAHYKLPQTQVSLVSLSCNYNYSRRLNKQDITTILNSETIFQKKRVWVKKPTSGFRAVLDNELQYHDLGHGKRRLTQALVNFFE